MRSHDATRRCGLTLVEVLIAFAIGLSFLGVLIGLFRSGSTMSRTEVGMISLQLEAQRALSRFIQEIQESILVVTPIPGRTQSWAVIRDRENRLALYSLVEGRIPGLFDLRRDITDPDGTSTSLLLNDIQRLTFTAHSDRALRLHVVLGDGERSYPLATQIRLRNHGALAP